LTADLVVELAIAHAPAGTGSTTCRLKVTNLGPAPAQAIVATIALSGEVTIGPPLCDRGRCARHDRGARCEIDALPNGAAATVELAVTPAGRGLRAYGSAISATPDPRPENNFADRPL
jgi:hypothetical protein